MMRPSTTVSVFFVEPDLILAFVCRNLKMRFCGDGRNRLGGGSVSSVGWVRTPDHIGDPARAGSSGWARGPEGSTHDRLGHDALRFSRHGR